MFASNPDLIKPITGRDFSITQRTKGVAQRSQLKLLAIDLQCSTATQFGQLQGNIQN